MRLDCDSSDWEFFFKSVQVLSGNTTRYYFEAIQKYIDEFFTASHSDRFSMRLQTNCVYRCARRECRSLARSIFDVDVTARAISECVPRDNSDCQVATISRILSQIRQSPRATGERIKMHPIGRIREIEKKRERADGRKKGRKYYRRFVSLSVTTH